MGIARRVEERLGSRGGGHDDVFDDAATGQGLLNYFLRGISCGAVTEDEALATGLTLEEIATVRPTSPQGRLAVNGIGPAKLERYGDDVLRIVGQA